MDIVYKIYRLLDGEELNSKKSEMKWLKYSFQNFKAHLFSFNILWIVCIFTTISTQTIS